MKKLHDVLVDAPLTDFKQWKKELRHHDITCDVINILDGVPQSTHYHPEFDALLHTFYVMKGVIALNRPDLLEAAFLHDVGKGLKTTIGSKRIYHFGHPKASAEFMSTIMNRLKYPELTLRVVVKHMDFGDIASEKLKKDPDLADMVWADKHWSKKLYLKDTDLLTLKLNKLKEKMVHLKQRFSRKDVIVLVGISGSGKSRYTRKIDKKLIVCPDDIRRELHGDVSNQADGAEIWKIVKVRMKIALHKYGKVILDATNVVKFSRVEFMSDFNDCYKTAIVFHADPDEAFKRIQKDIIDGFDRSNVPEKVVKRQYKNFTRGYKSLFNEFNKVKEIKCSRKI